MTREEKKKKRLGVSSQQHVKLLSRLICTRQEVATVTNHLYGISVDTCCQAMPTPLHPIKKIMKHTN